MRQLTVVAPLCAVALSCMVAQAQARDDSSSAQRSVEPSPLLRCLEPIARRFHVRIVESGKPTQAIACVPLDANTTLEQALDRLLKTHGLEWRRLDEGTIEIIAAPASTSLKLPALDVEGDPLPDIERPDHPLATPLVERATAATTLDRRWLDAAPLLSFNQLSWYAPNVYGTGQSLAIRGTERDSDYFPALTVTYDGIDLGTRLLDDELVPLDDVTDLSLARGPRTFEAGEGSQAGAIALKTAPPAAEPVTSVALGVGTDGARNAQLLWSGPLGIAGLGATVALDQHQLPTFVRQVTVPQANVDKRRNSFGRIKLSYKPETGFSAGLAALALSGDSSDRQVVTPVPVPGQTVAAFDPYDRNSYATDPVDAQTHARGAAGFVRYEQPDRWAIDAHASITTIYRDATEYPHNTQWTDQELRRREGITASDHPAPDWTIVAGIEQADASTAYYTPLASGQAVLAYFATASDSASVWAEHAFSSAWSAGLGVRWQYERTTVYPSGEPSYAYHVPIPLAVLEWRPWTNQAFSLSYGTGYRSGGQGNVPTVTYVPERSRNLELSWRAHWLDDTLHTTLSAFDARVNNHFTYYLTSATGDPLLVHVQERGLEFELDDELSQRWHLRAGLGVLSSHYSSFVYPNGDPTSEAPPQTVTIGARYGLEKGWYGAADAYHAASAEYYIFSTPIGRLPAYDVLSLRIGYRSAQWDAALIATNALDENFVERIQLSAANQSGYRLGDPRRVELRVKWSW